MPTPFTIAVPDERLADIRARVERFDWDDFPDAGGWRSGVGLADLRRLVDHWLTRYDWRAQEARLNRLPQFTAEVLGQRLHFVHAKGDGSKPPVMLVHGWPGSFLEFERLVEPLVADGHDVVVPSLPGYGFSGRPAEPIGPRRTAELFHRVMIELFGAGRYLLQGGDWGSAVTAWMAHGHPDAVAGLHLNMVLVQAADAVPKTPDELAWAKRRSDLRQEETGYSLEQGTRPQTLAFALTESPVGLAAWIAEKMRNWSDCGGDVESVFSKDEILANVSLYWFTGAIGSSFWPYYARHHGPWPIPDGRTVDVPMGYCEFPAEIVRPPRSLAERTFTDIRRWSVMPRGGHFAAMEQPDALADEIRAFYRPLRG